MSRSVGTTPNETVKVLKFGGSSFPTPEAYQSVARAIAALVARGNKVVVVVSAMSGTTGRLAELLEAIAPAHTPEDRDAVLGTAEVLAAALMRAALCDCGVTAHSLNGFQLGWSATGPFADGRLVSPTQAALANALDKASVCVVAGGQALQGDRLIMLGRNSSDLSAIAAASALGVSEVMIFSDIEGVCTGDPYLLDDTLIMARIPYGQAILFARAGAKILFQRCIEMARDNSIVIQCAALSADGTFRLGTRVGTEGRGIQVTVPTGAIAVRIDPEKGPTSLPASILPLADHPGLYATLSPGALTETEDAERLLPVSGFQICLAVDRLGNLTAHGCSPDALLTKANHLHAALTDGLKNDPNFSPLRRPLSKSRGSHSSVFQPLAKVGS